MSDQHAKAGIAARLRKEISEKIQKSDDLLLDLPNNAEKYRINQMKIRALEEEFSNLRDERYLGEKSIFISFSDKAQREYSIVEKKANEQGFKTKNGFDSHKEEQNNLTRALKGIKKSFCFLAIITPKDEFEIRTKREKPAFMPSIWLIEEKGMALALGKPYVLLIEETVHESIWKDTASEKRHFMFHKDNLGRQAEEALYWLSGNYDRNLRIRLN